MLRVDEDSRLPMFSHHNEFLLYIFKCKWNREVGNFVQFNNKKYLLQCKTKYNDKTIEI